MKNIRKLGENEKRHRFFQRKSLVKLLQNCERPLKRSVSFIILLLWYRGKALHVLRIDHMYESNTQNSYENKRKLG